MITSNDGEPLPAVAPVAAPRCRSQRWRRVAASLSVLVATALVSCGGSSATDPGGAGSGGAGSGGAVSGTIDVFAAASLAGVFADIEAGFEQRNPTVDVRLNLAGSSALREQLRQGAPADVFASASVAIFEDVEALDLVAGSGVVFARNRLRIAVPAGNPGEVRGIGDFARGELLLGLCSAGVPCGDLARQALEAHGVTPKIDTNEPDVRALLTKIEADELDAGIVYATDVIAGGDNVVGIDISGSDGTHHDVGFDDQSASAVEAAYPIGVMAGAPNPAAARAFVDFVARAEGRRILVDAGFVAP